MNRRQALAGLLGALAGDGAVDILGGPFGRVAARAETDSGEPAAFPLSVSQDGRYLHDAQGRPFLLTGDAAWSLIVEPTREEADFYLSTRRSQGFNALLVNLIEHKFSSNAPADAYGNRPFAAAGNFAEPNDRYFDNAFWVAKRAGEFGFLVLLAPAYLGFGGGDEGWFSDMKIAGPEMLHRYGRYVGQRFRDLKNIVWVHGGDFDAPDRSLVKAVVAGISEAAPGALHTVHSSRETDTAAYWRGEKWLGIDTVYTYDVFREVSSRYKRRHGLPIVMIEAAYENEHKADEQVIRTQAYGAMLGGAAGQVYGNNPVWHFSGPGIYFSFRGWRHALTNGGAASMTHLRRFLEQLEWWKIEPDNGSVLFSNGEKQDGYAICGVASDGSFAIAYTINAPRLTFRLPWHGAVATVARWYDPTAGTFLDAKPDANAVPDGMAFTAPERANANGYSDWLLLLTPAGRAQSSTP